MLYKCNMSRDRTGSGLEIAREVGLIGAIRPEPISKHIPIRIRPA